MLLPIPQRGDGQVKCLGELHLRHAETLPQDLHARHPAHLGQSFRSERPGVGISAAAMTSSSHGVEPRPIGAAARQGITRFHGYPRTGSSGTTSIPVLAANGGRKA
jgi:hypothetical protein